MSQLGQLINPYYDPRKNEVYEAFNLFFGNPAMEKIKNVNGFSVYMTKIHCLLGKTHRYLIVFVDQDLNPNGFSLRMEECEWISLQTRTLEENHDMKSHVFNVSRNSTLSQKIDIVSRDDEQTVYKAEVYPLIITLLNTKKNNVYQYQSKGTIISALETYQTIVSFSI